jgi:hypothetical protein
VKTSNLAKYLFPLKWRVKYYAHARNVSRNQVQKTRFFMSVDRSEKAASLIADVVRRDAFVSSLIETDDELYFLKEMASDARANKPKFRRSGMTVSIAGELAVLKVTENFTKRRWWPF